MENTEPHINVFPKLNSGERNKNNNTKFVPTDPDVDLILNPKTAKKNIDVLNMKHEPTEEEQSMNNTDTNKKSSESSYSWLIIILAIIVVILVIIIVWYVLKTNEENSEPIIPKPGGIPNNIIQPNMINPNQISQPSRLYQQFPQAPSQFIHPSQQFSHPMHPNNRPQTENLPVQTKSIPKPSPPTNKSSQPTKKELMATLNQMKLEPISEEEEEKEKPKEKKLTPKKPTASESQLSTEVENDGVDGNDEQDEKLANTFYRNLQQNIDNDNADEQSDENIIEQND
jgi:hypothetical protein